MTVSMLSKPFKEYSTKFIPYISAVTTRNAKAEEVNTFRVSKKREENSRMLA